MHASSTCSMTRSPSDGRHLLGAVCAHQAQVVTVWLCRGMSHATPHPIRFVMMKRPADGRGSNCTMLLTTEVMRGLPVGDAHALQLRASVCFPATPEQE